MRGRGLDGDALRPAGQSTAGRNYFFLQPRHLEALRAAGFGAGE